MSFTLPTKSGLATPPKSSRSIFHIADITYCAELREQSLGSATGKSNAWYNENRTPKPPESPHFYHRSLPDAETGEEVYQRVCAFADRLEASSCARMIVVAHGGSLQMLAARLIKLPMKLMETTEIRGSAGGVSRFFIGDDGERKLARWSDMSYCAL